MKILCELKDGRGQIDDIDNLGNRRVRSVGELMENQYRVGLLRMERAIRERMGSVDIDTVMPHDLINAKPAAAAVREFFGSSQLSQFMDQTNPLSRGDAQAPPVGAWPGRSDARARRLRGARRASDALRPHLPDRDAGRAEYRPDQLARHLRQGQQVRLHRDAVHAGEGRRGAARARATSRRWRRSGWSSRRPMRRWTATARSPQDLVSVRRQGDFRLVPPEDVTAIDVSPKQLVSVAAALIPFLENDDANRALMGSQHAAPGGAADPARTRRWSAPAWRRRWRATAAPRSSPAAPAWSTRSTARASWCARPTRTARRKGVDIYRLRKFMRSNQSTCINQRPLVKVGDRVPERRDHRRRPFDRARRAGAGAQRAVRVHALERLQLRGLAS